MSREVLRAGQQVAGRYTLKGRLGAGAFGSVWLASDAVLSRDIALKLLHKKHQKTRRVLDRFVREAEILMELDHPNIAKALGFSAEDEPYLVLELVEGARLTELIGRRAAEDRHFSREEVRSIAAELCAALTYAHGKQVVHRDLKPSNVLVWQRGGDLGLKVLDFGIAKILGGPGEHTTQGRMLGSLLYLSPEQCEAEPVDHRADLFAFGTILFEMLTLRQPWVRDDDDRPVRAIESPLRKTWSNESIDVMERIARLPRPSPAALRPVLGAEGDRFFEQAFAIPPRDRFQSASEVLAALDRVLELLPDDTTAAATRATVVEGRGEPTVTRVPGSDAFSIVTSPSAGSSDPFQDRDPADPADRPVDPFGRTATRPGPAGPSMTPPGPSMTVRDTPGPSMTVRDTPGPSVTERDAPAPEATALLPDGGTALIPERTAPLARTEQILRRHASSSGLAFLLLVVAIAVPSVWLGFHLAPPESAGVPVTTADPQAKALEVRAAARPAASAHPAADPASGAPANDAQSLGGAAAAVDPRRGAGSTSSAARAPEVDPGSSARAARTERAARRRDRDDVEPAAPAAVSPRPHAALHALLAGLERDPENGRLAQELSAKIVEAAKALPDRALGAKIERRAALAAMSYDAKALETLKGCVAQLASASPGSP